MLIKFLYGIVVLSVVAGCASPDSSHVGSSEITRWRDDKAAAISITYDDATINQFRRALPVMDSLGFKGTFFINTGDIPGSKFPPKYFGKPLAQIVKESASPTTQDNLFERASALRFLNIENAIGLHNSAGSLYEQGKSTEAFKVIDDAYALARKQKSIHATRPLLLTGELITWPEIEQFAANGHEFGNHTISHPRLAVLDEANLLYELEKCKEEIRGQLGEHHTFSAECPFGTENERVMEYAYKIHPALRNRMPADYLEELNRWSDKTPSSSSREYIQWQRGPLQKTTLEQMKSWVDTLLLHNNVWLVLTFHGVDSVGWEAKPHQELQRYFEYMKAHEDKLWICTFGDGTRYMRERMAAGVSATIAGSSIIVTVSHTLDQKMYGLPLTIKTYIDEDWKKVSVRQGDGQLPFKIFNDAKGKYILYQVVPNSESVTIVEG
jgi:peptidoglycan/xylan/chitin deacetylase (PgdA/CDA1 family)